MGENTKIEWCDHSWNPWIGCTKVSPGCDHCYAAQSTPARVLRARGIETWGADGQRFRTNVWGDPPRWNRRHAEFFARHGRRQRVFCASLADWLDNEAPIEYLVDLLDLIRLTPDLDWLLLSKRIGNWRGRVAEAHSHCAWADDSAAFASWTEAWLRGTPPAHVWIGATVVNQAEADRDIPKLLRVPARVRFLSIEPMLGPIDVRWAFSDSRVIRCPHCMFATNDLTHGPCPNDGQTMRSDKGIDWVIAGGESGPGARPMHPDWARSLRDQCEAAGVPFLFKQWGEWGPAPEGVQPHRVTLPGGRAADGRPMLQTTFMARPGKKAAGRLLDGREHNGFPEVQHA